MERKLISKVQMITGSPTSVGGRWAQVYYFSPPEEKIKKLRGELFVVVDILASEKFDAALAVKLVLDSLSEEYYGNLEGPPLQALEKALSSSRHRLVDLTLGPSGAQSLEVEFNLSVAVLWGKVLYLAQIGRGGIYLLRKGILKEISSGEETTLSVVSGMVKAEDVIILGSSDFKKNFSKERILKSLDVLEEEIQTLENPAGVAILIAKLTLEELPGKEEIVHIISPEALKEKGKVAFSFFKKIWKNFFVKLVKEGPKDIYVEKEERPFLRPSKAPSKLKPALFILGALFLISVTLTIRRSRENLRQKSVVASLSLAKKNLDLAEQLVDLNNVEARALLREAEEKLLEVSEFAEDSKNFSETLAKVREVLDKVNKVKRVKAKLLYDLLIQDEKINPYSFSGTKNTLFVADKETNTVYKLDLSLEPPSVENATGGEVKEPFLVEAFAEKLFVLGKEGLLVFDLFKRTSEVLEVLNIEKIEDLGVYLGNVYLLDVGENQILKIFPTEEGYSSFGNWLKGEFDLSGASSLAVDGFIYLGFENGQVLKFEGGERLDFELKNLDEPLGKLVALFTSSELDFLYLLDSEKKRIVVVNKDGYYHSQYLFEGTDGDFKDFWIDSEGKKIYLLSGTKIWESDL